ncbi:ROK family glucokinase [Aquibacillus halophilus]|uniref:Glucokinase n=1 Tax=Aquibacillus halophilus TaxID=930132 RepID=A0A6A8DBW7_9BACI|nr:ROK family glucokinase [Aquibacillus halophilus]MRH43128.1 ROK family glucokinase [Aquibacillus halophilus]
MNKDYFIGVDIGGTTVKIAIINNIGDILNKWEILTNKDNSGASIPNDIWISLDENLGELHIDKNQIHGIGVGAPGFVDTETGNVSLAVNIGWKDFDLGPQLEKLSNLPVFVDNDANIAALGENWKGAGNLADFLIAVTLGTGVGGGIIANGKIINGFNGTAGEIGHLTVEPGGAPCNCGRRGCLETIASATGIVRQANNVLNTESNSMIKEHYKLHGEITAKDVFDLAKKGDSQASEIVEKITDFLGLAIANAATLINPSKIVIGGGVSKAGAQLLVPLRQSFTNYALPRISEECEFVIAQLGNDAGVIGGAYLVKNQVVTL